MICPYCTAENRDGAKFCSHCGRELTDAAQQAPVQQPYEQQVPVQQPYAQQMPGGQPDAQQSDAAFRRAVSDAKNALIMSIVGIFCFGIILEPIAIVNARKAKKVLSPGDEGYGNAQAAEIIGWIAVGLWILVICGNLLLILSN